MTSSPDHEETPPKVEDEAVSSSSSSSDGSSATGTGDDPTSDGGLTRTLLLAVPLFCKFAVVLLIKFLTDAVVYPLLFLYRVARITKRKVRALLFDRPGKLNETPINGENGSSGTSGSTATKTEPDVAP